MDPDTEGQVMGLEDPILSLQSAVAAVQQKSVDNGIRTTSEPWVDHSHNNCLKT